MSRCCQPFVRCCGFALVMTLGWAAGASAAMAWTYPAALNPDAATDGARHDYAPQVAFGDAGVWVAVWYARDISGGPFGDDLDILFARSTDAGTTWSLPAPIDPAATTDDLDDTGPTVHTDGAGHWLVVWRQWDGALESDIDLRYATSTNGLDWSQHGFLNSDHAADALRDHDDTPDIAIAPTGAWIAVWQKRVDSPAGDEGDVYISRSLDHGVSWSAVEYLHPSMATDMGDDIVPRIDVDRTGRCVCMWRSDGLVGTNGLGDNDMFVSRSDDAGVTWTTPTALNSDHATDSYEDFEGDVASGGAGVWVAAWYREGFGGTDRDLMFARSADDGVTWSAPAALNTNWATDWGDDGRPRLRGDGAGHWVATWYSQDLLGLPIGADRDLFYAYSCDDGIHWSPPGVLNGNAMADLGFHDWAQEIKLIGDGRALVVWQAQDSLGGTVGTDRDIFYATARLLVCGDADQDADFDLTDFAVLQPCIGATLPDDVCDVFDFDADQQIGLTDLAGFIGKLSGPR